MLAIHRHLGFFEHVSMALGRLWARPFFWPIGAVSYKREGAPQIIKFWTVQDDEAFRNPPKVNHVLHDL